MDELPLTSTMMIDWFTPKETLEGRANRDVIEALANKPLEDPRVLQTFLCRWCLNPVTEIPKSWGEYAQLRAILMIPDAVKDPPICSECYYSAVWSFNRHATCVGTNNSGHDNLLLRRQIEGSLST